MGLKKHTSAARPSLTTLQGFPLCPEHSATPTAQGVGTAALGPPLCRAAPQLLVACPKPGTGPSCSPLP